MGLSTAARTYFPGLNALRFFAAFAIFGHHVEQIKGWYGWSNSIDLRSIAELGRTAVTFFFVLSGFLISHQLLVEKTQTGSIKLSAFYLRRALRIWPLYFLTLVLVFFVYPHTPLVSLAERERLYADFFPKLALYALLLPNFAICLYPGPFLGAHTWSIGVEEQFYLSWPWLVKRARRALGLFLLVIVGYVAIKSALFWIPATPRTTSLLKFVQATRIDCMAIGALGAWAIASDSRKTLAILGHPVLQAMVYAGLLLCLSIGQTFSLAGVDIGPELYSLGFLVLMVNAPVWSHKLGLENRFLRYLGRISYGIYMFHPVVIVVTVRALHKLGVPSQNYLCSYLLVPTVSFALTVGVSSLSYHFLESRFLRSPRLGKPSA